MKRSFPEYLDWIRDQRCAVCMAEGPCQAHHLKGEFHQSGVGLKAPDYLAMPLCYLCHMEFHAAVDGWRDAQRIALLQTIVRAFNVGMLTVKDGTARK